MRKVMALASALFLVVAPLSQAYSQEEISAERKAAADALIASMGGVEMFQQMFDLMAQQLVPAMLAMNPTIDEKTKLALQIEVLSTLREEAVSIVDITEEIYAKHFTTEELNDMQAFYQTETGQKMLEKLPIVTQESMQAGMIWGQSLGPKILPKVLERLREKGHDI